MQGIEFRRWAEHSYLSYGSDPWFFLRELAQNSRDAGAQNIWIEAGQDRMGWETFAFRDDGCGMSAEHARRYLFRLYASSKVGDRTAAGKYGVGFWTILKFKPARVVIESRTGKESWALALDEKLEARSCPCRLDQSSGTQITLIRPATTTGSELFQQQVAEALNRYCLYLRGNDSRARPLAVYFQERLISQPLRLAGPLSLSFHRGAVEGAVALGPQPRVTLMARGLPVWQGVCLDELGHAVSPAPDQHEYGAGLAPVFLLNGNDLDITINRRASIDNRALRKVRRVAQAALDQLVDVQTRRVFAPSGWRRLLQAVRRTVHRIGRPSWKQLLLMLLVLLPLEFFIISRLRPPENGRREPARASPLNGQYGGPTVTAGGTGQVAADLPVVVWYQPNRDVLLKLFSAEFFDPLNGFVRDRTQEEPFPAGATSQSETAFSIRLDVKAIGPVQLPLPQGCWIDPSSLSWNGSSGLPWRLDRSGDMVAEVAAPGLLTYRCLADSAGDVLTPDEAGRLTRLAGQQPFPERVERELASLVGRDIEVQIAAVLKLTDSLLRYDRSFKTASAYRQYPSDSEWLSRVLAIGRGDCDVINGLAVLLLRRLGVPARLVVGLVGRNGRASGELHSWSEYHSGGWRVVDASLAVPEWKAVTTPGALTGLRRIFVFLLTLLIFILLTVILVVRSRHQRRILRSDGVHAVRKELAQMALGALLHPQAWSGSRIWDSALIPTFNGRPLSINDVLRALRRNRLAVAEHRNFLVAGFTRAGIQVLDRSRKDFAPLIRIFSGANDLDRIGSLKAIPVHKIPDHPAAALLRRANEALIRSGRRRIQCLLAFNLPGMDLLDVCLPKSIGRRMPPGGGHRFVAVNARSSRLAFLASLFAKNPRLAVLRFIRLLERESDFFSAADSVAVARSLLSEER